MNRLLSALLISGLVLTSTVSSAFAAETLDSAKAKGYLGEQADGYLGAPSGQIPAEVLSLMNDVNSKRKTMYQGIAKKNGTELNAVEALAGKKAIDLTPSGQFVKMSGKCWEKK